MSYRNPTYYGIVEDMGAFSKAFTSSFGQIKQAVDAERAAQAEQARQDDAMMAKGYEFVLNQADDLEGETYKTFIEYGNNLIKDGNFARLSASDQQLLLGKIAGVANTSNSVEEIQANLASYEKLIPANLNSAVKGFFKGENKLITEGSGVNTNLYLTYKENGEDKKIAWDKLTSVYNNDLLTQQGDEKYAKDLIKNGVDWVENRLEILAKQNRGSVNTEEQIDNLLKEWVISNKKDIKNQKMDFLWNNGMDDSEKVFETENGEKTDMSGYEYNLYKMRTNPNIATKNGMIEGETLVNVAERGRDMLIEEHVRNKIKNLVDTSYYIPPEGSGDEEETSKPLSTSQINDLKDFVLNTLPHDKKATTVDMNKIVSGLQKFGLTIEEDADKPGYQIRYGGSGKLFTVSPNSPASANLLSIANALGIDPIQLTEEDIDFSLYKRN